MKGTLPYLFRNEYVCIFYAAMIQETAEVGVFVNGIDWHLVWIISQRSLDQKALDFAIITSKFGRSGCYKLSVFVPSHSVFVFHNVKHFNELCRFFWWYCCYLNNFRSSRGKRFYEKAAVKNILKFSEKRNSDRDIFSNVAFTLHNSLSIASVFL